MTATGHHPRCDLGLPSLSPLSLILQRIDIKLSPFCQLPIISTELTQLRYLRFIIPWFKVSNKVNSVMVGIILVLPILNYSSHLLIKMTDNLIYKKIYNIYN